MTEQKQASIKKELERYQLSYRKDGEPIVVRRFGKKNVFFLKAEKEIDFMVPDEKLAIQVSYSINDQTTKDREVPPLVKYSKAHEDYNCLLITYDDEGTEEGIPVVPVWKLLMDGGLQGRCGTHFMLERSTCQTCCYGAQKVGAENDGGDF